jgi:hypothetical protein
MKRSALALLGLLALPLAAMAQTDRTLLTNEPPPERLPESKFSITPYLGARVPFASGDVILVNEAGDQHVLRWERGGAPMVGLDFSGKVAGPVQFVVGGAFSPSRTDELRLDGATVSDSARTDGAAYWMAKAGVQVRLADPNPDDRHFHPSALITAAPALIWTDWNDIDGFPAAATSSTHHFAANLGVDAAARIGRSDVWSFMVGLQDYLVFWNNDSNVSRDATFGAVLLGEPVAVDYASSSSNIVTLRFGVSYRFR